MTGLEEQNSCSSQQTENTENQVKHKPSKRGILYLSSIPPYMNVTKIKEVFVQYGKLGRVYLQLFDKDTKTGDIKKKKRKTAKKFTEGWVEFEKKCVAKRVASLLNNTQWTHLHERLAYERAAKSKKLKAEIQLAKKKTNFFTANLDIKKKNKDVINKEFKNIDEIATGSAMDVDDQEKDSRNEFLQSLFS